MNPLRIILKKAKISPEQVSEAMSIPIRTLSYHMNSGRIPYAMVYKLSKIIGVPMDEMIPQHIREMWLFTLEEQVKINKPRGKRKQNDWGKKEPAPVKHIRTIKERAEAKMASAVATPYTPEEAYIPPVAVALPSGLPVTPKRKTVPRETEAPAKHKPSIADLMQTKPAEPVPTEPEPDFTGVSDDLFSTSMASENNPVKRGKR